MSSSKKVVKDLERELKEKILELDLKLSEVNNIKRKAQADFKYKAMTLKKRKSSLLPSNRKLQFF